MTTRCYVKQYESRNEKYFARSRVFSTIFFLEKIDYKIFRAAHGHAKDAAGCLGDKNTCPLKNSGFSIFLPQTRQRKSFVRRKVQSRSNTTLPMHLSNKQTDPTNAFLEIVRQHSNTQWGMRTVKSVS